MKIKSKLLLIILIISIIINIILTFNLVFTKREFTQGAYAGEIIVNKQDIKHNPHSRKLYHRVDCPLVSKISSEDILIISLYTAQTYSFNQCKTCNPPQY